MSAEPIAVRLRPYRWECAWGVFALANLTWMIIMPDWVSVPFHFIWVSLTVLYGFRLWSDAFTWTIVGLVVGGTGVVLCGLWLAGMPTDEVLEVPLMFGMFLAMMLHTRRRRAALAQLQRVSEQNARLLAREHAFIQNASHELRTPITVALAHAELVQLTVGRQSVREDVAIVADELGRLRGLTDRLLLLAAVDAPESVERVPTDLVELVATTVRRWSPTPRRWRIGRHDDATVLADAERLMVALDAVLENAIKVTRDGDLIELSVIGHDGNAVIEVSDSGPGIAPDMLDAMFERFTRGGPSPGSWGGFGLGLAIVDSIVGAHGGTVTARNRAEGGAVIALRLPLAGEWVAEAAAAPGVRSAARDDAPVDGAADRLASLA